MAKSLQAKVYAQLEKAPNRRAIGFVNARGEISWRTWEQFYARAAGYAAQLKDNGLKQGDVCILVLPSKEFCATALTATMLLGAVPLLIAPVHLPGAHSNLMQVLNRTIGKTKARIVDLQRIINDLESEDPENLTIKSYKGMLAAQAGDRQTALQMYDWLEKVDLPYIWGENKWWQAMIAGALGEKSRAVTLLQDAFRNGTPYGIHYHRWWEFFPLHGFPEFEEFIKPKR